MEVNTVLPDTTFHAAAMPSQSLPGTTSNPTSGGGLDPSVSSRTIDFAGNFLASPAWEAHILTPLSNPNVNYTCASWANISSIAWVASSSSSSSGPNETTIDSLAIGGTTMVESSTRKWLSRGEHATGERFITIQIQSWLRQNPDSSMGGSGGNDGGNGGRRASDSNSPGGGSSSYTPQPGDYMRLRIEWATQQGSSTKGTSTSGLFTVADSVEGVSDKWSRDIVQGFDNVKLNGGEEPATAATKTALPSASDAATGTGSSPQSATTNPGKSSRSSRLSTGAIAGIAVGCGIGLILGATALVWFFITLRRRRRRRRQHSSKRDWDAHDKATALMDDNGNSVANVADSPQPPHSEDNIVHDSSRRAQPVHSAAGVPPRGEEATRNNRDSYSYPLARTVSPDVVEERGESSRDAPSRATNFAERGMTDDERRRWEEEERHLDDEIARNKAF